MKIGILKETKVPEDNRVILSPNQISRLSQDFPQCEFFVQKSDIRVFSDEDYLHKRIQVVDSLQDCDILFGIKEADISSLLPRKHYFFFGHVAKMQPYNRSLLQQMIKLGITFTDYEYLVNEEGRRLCAFGWWAGVVGAYNTLRAYGLRYKKFNLPQPHSHFTLSEMQQEAQKHNCDSFKIVITGNGKASQGAQYFLNRIGIKQVSSHDFINQTYTYPTYTVVELADIVYRTDSTHVFDREDFRLHPEGYNSCFMMYAKHADLYISCHYWGSQDPIYLTKEDLRHPDLKLKIIGDVTCDIKGSIQSTLRASTHKNPFYDYNPYTEKEEEAFSSEQNFTIMAVDTLPNALAMEASEYFGDLLIQYVIYSILNGELEKSKVIKRATILQKGVLTDRFAYLQNYASK